MKIGTQNWLTQLQFITFKTFTYKISKQKKYKKIYSLVQKNKITEKIKQLNLYKKLTKAKSNFDSN